MTGQLEQALCELRDTRAAIDQRATPAFRRWQAVVRDWQAHRLAARHRERATRHDSHALLDFLTDTFYRRADWSELTADPHRVASRIGRVIADARPLVVAVRLQHSFDLSDAAVARALVERGGSPRLCAYGYVRAFRAVSEAAHREQQLAWVQELIERLGGYADSRGAYVGFRLARTPARALGMGRTYDLLAEGFAALRAARDPQAGARAAIDAQRALLTRLLRAA